ncbi:cystathionine beta-lyase [Nisaea acidiphila]|uniref:Cystathionine beta-lyase n=1 Tax=Nisaea acidiphila TaxID=1862145 RepID=A0A9J7ARR9_9PROT|nr:cystathionine beta-lyase [Nisaea acidiphila]UUX50056.1 cystathionine beta-lyase [Nisaea acidiphila]
MQRGAKAGKKTLITHAGRDPHANHGVVNPPVYHASTILKPSLDALEASRKPDFTGFRYGRRGTPTTRSFEEAVAELYGVESAVAVSSGLAAICCAILSQVSAGDHILITDNVYFPTRKFAGGFLERFGVEATFFDPMKPEDLAELIRPETKVVYLEAPGTMTFEVCDVPALASIAHEQGATVIMDNTWATALYFDAFGHGVDIVVEAVTKYICGHSDVMMGVIVSKDAQAAAIRDTVFMQGNCSGPDDLYLAQRGLRTMAVRLAENERNALALAKWLSERPEVDRVLHPALPSCPGHEIWKRDFTGASGLFSFLLKPLSRAALAAFLDGLEYYGMGASWGGYESLILPGDPAAARTVTTWNEPGQLLRIHAGLEDVTDLKADLDAGFERIAALA